MMASAKNPARLRTPDALGNRAAVLANQQGTLTSEQYDLLHLTSGLTFWFTLGSVIAVIGIVTWAITRQMASLPTNIPPIPLYFWVVLALVIGIPLLYLGNQMLRSARTRRELAAGLIASEDGSIEWTGRRYRVASSVNKLRSIYGPLNVMPGRYRFYFLPGSRLLVSVDPRDPQEVYHRALTDILGQALGFTHDDLAVNRTGRITPAQANRMRACAILTWLLTAACLLVLAAFPVLAITFRSTGYWAASGIWFAICIFVLPSMIRNSIIRWRESHDPVTTTQGTGSKSLRYLTRSVIKSYVINHQRFDVSPRAYEAMIEGLTYRIHHTPRTRKILAMEVVG